MEIVWRSRETLVSDLENSDQGTSGPEELDCPPLVQRFLRARGLTGKEEAAKFLMPRLSDLKDPLKINGIKIAVSRLVEAYKAQEKICVYADFDLDGISGLALLDEGFRQLGFKNVVLAQPKRLSDGYGFHSHLVEELADQGVSLIVTVDVGITAWKACETARARHVQVIITDHHQVGDKLPEALTIVNPNLPGDQSGLGFLCGAGVAFYLLRALKRALVDEKLIPENQFDLKSVLDCFCIATVTDMVPLVEDNRVLVKAGLLQLESTMRPGLRALLKELDLDGRSLTSQDVAIRFAPKLNALSRMEMGILPIDLYTVRDQVKAEEMVKTVLKNNSTRVQLQGEADTEANEFLKTWPHDQFVFVASKNFHKGVVGLIATKLALSTHLPAFVGSMNEEGVITGSARLPQGASESLLDALGAASGILQRFGGHDAAAGFELLASRQEEFISALVEHYQHRELQTKKIVDYDVDASYEEINELLMRWLDSLGPFGQGFAQPLFCFKNIFVKELVNLKGGHLRLKLEDTVSGNKGEAIFFSPPASISAQLAEALDTKSAFVNILGELQWNYFSGRKTVQLLIKDLQFLPRSAKQRENL
jgi:single-stranded-DNA-specific exonuclease